MIVFLTSVSEVGEAVQIDTVALLALVDLEQTALAHCGVELHYGNGQGL